MKRSYLRSTNMGLASLVSVILVSVLLMTVGLSMSLISVGELRLFESQRQGQNMLNLIDSCVDETLLKLNKNNSVVANVTLPMGSCTVVTNSVVGNTWDITVSVNLSGFSRQVNIVVNRSTTLGITRRTEVL